MPSLGYVAHAQAFQDGMLVRRFRLSGHAVEADVAPEPISFAPMRVIYRFEGWRRGRPQINSYLEVDGKEADRTLGSVPSEPQADGSVRVLLHGQSLSFRQTSDRKAALVEVGASS